MDSRLRGNDGFICNDETLCFRHSRAGGNPYSSKNSLNFFIIIHMEKGGFVYIMSSRRRGTLYVGVTSDLVRRVWQHREGVTAGFTTKYDVKKLVYFECHNDIESAISREKAMKKWRRACKVRLIEERNPTWADLWPEIAV